MSDLQKFYFNTGVKYDPSIPLMEYQEWIDGVKQIAFYCKDVPEKAEFLFASLFGNLSSSNNIVPFKIEEGGLFSNYAYFKLNTNE